MPQRALSAFTLSERASSESAGAASERPPLSRLGSEPWRAAWEFMTHVIAPDPIAIGDGHPVIIFPGMGADGHSVAPLRKHCDKLGYTAMDWGQGFNTGPQGDVDKWMEKLAASTAAILDRHDGQATLIGWSLGGLYAREIAKVLTQRVRQVITIGTPFNASADQTNVDWLYRLLSDASAKMNPALGNRLRTPPPVPTTSIYSRTDGVVAWQSCRHDIVSAEVQDIEVESSHCGMGWNPAVLGVIANRLGQRPGRWRPYVGNGLLG
ncbi:MAG: alpha/beta fold hydrolase [Usitatibacteraceae bacterium]